MNFILKLLGGSLGPWILGGAALVAAAGWAAAGVQSMRYLSVTADLEATKAQIALDANQAAKVTIEALRAAHTREMAELQAQLEAHRQAVASARAENTRLNSRLGAFQRELEALHHEPETHAYLSQSVPDLVLGRLRDAQHRHEAGTD